MSRRFVSFLVLSTSVLCTVSDPSLAQTTPLSATPLPAARALEARPQAQSLLSKSLWAQGRRAYQKDDYAQAARLLSQLLLINVSSTRRTEAEQLLSISEARVGHLRISSDIVGTDILVDNRSVGQTPLPGSWYVEPGAHSVEARSAQLPTQVKKVEAIAGGAVSVVFRLQPASNFSADSALARRLMGTSEGQRAPNDRLDAAKTFHTLALLTTGIVAVASLAAGVGYRVASTNRAAEARQLRAELSSVPEPTGQPCSQGTLFSAHCERLDQLDSDSYERQKSSERAFLAFAATGTFTLIYGLYIALSSDAPPAAGTARQRKTVQTGSFSPGVTPLLGGAQLSLSASF